MQSSHGPTINQTEAKTEAQKSYSRFMKIGTICVLLLAIAFIATFFFSVPIGTLLFAAILLACPLLHIFMMKNGGHKH